MHASLLHTHICTHNEKKTIAMKVTCNSDQIVSTFQKLYFITIHGVATALTRFVIEYHHNITMSMAIFFWCFTKMCRLVLQIHVRRSAIFSSNIHICKHSPTHTCIHTTTLAQEENTYVMIEEANLDDAMRFHPIDAVGHARVSLGVA